MVAGFELGNGDARFAVGIFTDDRQREKTLVISVKREAVVGFLLEQTPAQQKENQAAERIAVVGAALRKNFKRARKINRRKSDHDGNFQRQRALTETQIGRAHV